MQFHPVNAWNGKASVSLQTATQPSALERCECSLTSSGAHDTVREFGVQSHWIE